MPFDDSGHIPYPPKLGDCTKCKLHLILKVCILCIIFIILRIKRK